MSVDCVSQGNQKDPLPATGASLKRNAVPPEFAAFESARFHGGADDTDRYLTVELLILDDLGTELGGAFTTACLYDIINTRLVRGLPTVMSTNLSPKELTDRYGERIASRLFGEYTPLVFCGEDVRKEKMGMQ